MDALHSLYFDFQEHLKAVTGRNPKAFKAHQERLTQGGSGWWPLWVYRAKRAWRWLRRPVPEAFRRETADEKGEVTLRVNLVFLVDDLDRCLPDKAVEVLEAIKIFLEVPGCVFVLALTQTLGEDAAAGAVPVQAGRPEFAQLADEERLFEAFSSGDLVGLRAVLEQEREALQGRLLPDGMVMWWLERENTLAWWSSEPPAPQAAELWAAVGPYLSQWGVLRLAAELGVGVLRLAQGIQGFMFAAAAQVPRLMADLERRWLSQHTPCAGMDETRLVQALATTHAELVIIHPFREGNGRSARLLAWLMALQAGLPSLDFSPMQGRGKTAYIQAIHAAFMGDERPMQQVFSRVLAATWRSVCRLQAQQPGETSGPG